jgi:hypothetical protein
MRRTGVCLLVLGIALMIPAAAEEILHLTNGTTMAVRSHEMKDGMIHVDLGSNGFIAFPAELVERIEGADGKIKLTPSRPMAESSGVTQMAAGQGRRAPTSDAKKAEFEVQAAQTQPKGKNVVTDENGLNAYKPFRGSRNAGRRSVGAVGNTKLLQGGGRYAGTVPLGNTHVIGGTMDPRGRGRPPAAIGIEPASGSNRPTGEHGEKVGNQSAGKKKSAKSEN